MLRPASSHRGHCWWGSTCCRTSAPSRSGTTLSPVQSMSNIAPIVRSDVGGPALALLLVPLRADAPPPRGRSQISWAGSPTTGSAPAQRGGISRDRCRPGTVALSGARLLRSHRLWAVARSAALGVLGYWLIRSLAARASASTISPYRGLIPSSRSSCRRLGLPLSRTLAALPVAILAVALSVWGRAVGWIERLCYLGYGLPGIVIALAFVFIGARYLTSALSDVAVADHRLRRPLLAAGTLGARRARRCSKPISPRLEEAARNLGRTPHGAGESGDGATGAPRDCSPAPPSSS